MLNGRLAFTFRDCDSCVSLARKILKKMGGIDWWLLEALLLLHQDSHPAESHPIHIYPAMRCVPDTDHRELTGFMFINFPYQLITVENEIQEWVARNGVTDVSALQGYIWRKTKCYWLNVEIVLAKDQVFARINLVDDVDISLLSKILSEPKLHKVKKIR